MQKDFENSSQTWKDIITFLDGMIWYHSLIIDLEEEKGDIYDMCVEVLGHYKEARRAFSTVESKIDTEESIPWVSKFKFSK